MDLTHRFIVPATLDAAWAAFSRLDVIAGCFPGATVTEVDGADYRGFVKIKLGPVPLTYNGTARYVEVNEAARRMVVEARGQDRRGNGTASARVTAAFTASGNLTDIQVLSDLSISGRPAQFGAGVISDVSDRLLDQFVDCITVRFIEGELAAGPVAGDGQPTIEIPVVEVTVPDSEDDSDFAGAASRVSATVNPPPTARPYAYTLNSREPRPDLHVVRTVAPVVVRRYWPYLLGAAAVGLLALAITRGRRG